MSLISGYMVVEPWMLREFTFKRDNTMRAEISKRVYAKYPITEKEKECKQEMTKREYLRAEYRKQLMTAKEKEKKIYQ